MIGKRLDEKQNFTGFAPERGPEGTITTALNDESEQTEEEKVAWGVDLGEIASDSDDGEGNHNLNQSVAEENDMGYVRRRTYSVELGNLSEDKKKMRG